jgi:diaminohydroxyphosphoribosylaminopyrimidine deaminase/5-amino-6-(5-phosphoribosylamino)uracil reductase
VELIAADGENNAAFIAAALGALAQRGLTRVLVEGGGEVAASLLDAGLVDEIAWFRAGKIMGADARPAIGSLLTDKLATVPSFQRTYALPLGPDSFEMFTRAG